MCAPYMKPALKNLYNLLFMIQGDLNIDQVVYDVQELLLIFLDEIIVLWFDDFIFKMSLSF